MKVEARNIAEHSIACDALILPIIEGEGMKPYASIDIALGGLPSRLIREKKFKPKHGETCLIHSLGKLKAQRVLLLGLGDRREMSPEKIRQAGGKAAYSLRDSGLSEAALSTLTIESLKTEPTDFAEGFMLACYKYSAYKKAEDKGDINKLILLSSRRLQAGIRRADVAADAVCFARDLINTPSNDMTPTSLANAAKRLSGRKVRVEVIERSAAQRLGMGAYLSVAKGSHEPPKFIVARYSGGKSRPIALIGKSITFDSGGISLKPSDGMEKMKYDMSGGAIVLAVVKAAAELSLPVNLIGILPACENLPGGSASRPGDVVKTIGGKTIEIINTDAEGRLALSDAMGYARRLKPSAMIDIATLTGACSVALGGEAIAMMGNSDRLMGIMDASSASTGERVWRMPLYDEYKDYIKSDIADLKNSGGKSGSLVTAGYFLKEFAGDVPWVHLDIAGTAWNDKDRPYSPKGASGIGVRLILNFLGRL